MAKPRLCGHTYHFAGCHNCDRYYQAKRQLEKKRAAERAAGIFPAPRAPRLRPPNPFNYPVVLGSSLPRVDIPEGINDDPVKVREIEAILARVRARRSIGYTDC